MGDLKRRFYPETKYGGFSDIDGLVAFFSRVNALLEPSFTVLDIGCGRGSCGDDSIAFRRNLRILKGKCQKVIGIDVDESAKGNPFVDEFHIIRDNNWPLPDESIDLAICNAVLEHIEEPNLFFSECKRVIKPGGYLCITTTNLLSYVGIISKIIPDKFHFEILKRF